MTDLVDFLYGGSGGAKRYTIDDALKAEGVTGMLADVARSIYEQESGSGRNTRTSNAGAVGHMQIIPETFARFADKGWNASNTEHNLRTGIRYLKAIEPLAKGDPALIGAGYYGGEGAVPLAAKGVALRDPRNPNAPDTLQYGKQVASRLPKTDLVDWLYAENTGADTAKPEQQIYIPTQTGGDPRLQQRDPAAAQQRRESMPALNTLMDFAQGASGVGRGGLNLINQMAPNSGIPAQGRSDLVSPGMTGAKLAGSVLDPGALLVGGAIGKALPYTPMLGNGFMGGARSLAQNLAGGAAVGAPLGALNAAAEDANVTQGATLGATVGAAANVVLPPTIKALGNLAGKAFDMLKGRYGDVVAARILQQASGPDLQRIKQMAANAPADETAAQALAPANNARLSALGAFAERSNPDYFNTVAGRQAQARIDALAQVAGGDTQTASQQAQRAVRNELNAITSPMRETELAAANTAGQVGQRLEPRLAAQQAAAQSALQDRGRFQTMAAQQEALARGGVVDLAGPQAGSRPTVQGQRNPIQGTPSPSPAGQPTNEPFFNVGATGGRAPARVTPDSGALPGDIPFRMRGQLPEARLTDNFAQSLEARAAASEAAGIEATRKSQAALTKYQLDSLAAHGLKPLDTDAVSNALSRKISAPGTRMNELQVDVLNNVRQKIAEAKQVNNGIVDAKDLYEIRKSAVNRSIEKLLSGVSPEVQKQRAAQLLGEVRPLIDEAIEKAGGTGWTKYLNAYSSGAKIAERQKLGAEALGYAKDSPRELVKLARGDKPDVVSKIMGGEPDITKALGSQFPVVKKAADEIARDETITSNASKGYEALATLLNDNYSRFRLPNLLNRHVMLTNRIMSEVEARVNVKTAAALTKAMESGNNFAEAINFLPLQDRSRVIQIMNKAANDPALRAASLNALLTEQK